MTSSKTTTFTADSNHSFNGSAVSDTTQKSAAVPGAVSATPGYTKIQVSGSYCSITVGSASVTSGNYVIAANGATITWTANSGYSFSEGTTQDATKTATVAIDTYSYSNSAVYKNITVTGVNSVADTASGYRRLDNYITWTANANCAFNSTGTTTTKQSRIKADTTDYDGTPGYIYCYITNDGGCTVSPSIPAG